MASILGMYKKFEALDTDQVAHDAVEETKETLADLNLEQMHHGIDADGTKIGLYRNEQYAEMKYAMNPLAGFGNADLKLTGAFYGGYYVRVEGDKIIEGSSDSKSDNLEQKYGHIFGLSAPYRREYVNEALAPAFRSGITAQTGLKFGL